MAGKRLNGFAIFLFVVAAAGLVITVLTGREVMQDMMGKPAWGDPGYRGDAINGYIVYVATQFSQLVVLPLGLGVIVEMVSRLRRP